MNTTTAAKAEGKTLTVRITNDVESYYRTGIVSIDNGMAYLTMDRGTLHEYAICLGGPNTPVEYR